VDVVHAISNGLAESFGAHCRTPLTMESMLKKTCRPGEPGGPMVGSTRRHARWLEVYPKGSPHPPRAHPGGSARLGSARLSSAQLDARRRLGVVGRLKKAISVPVTSVPPRRTLTALSWRDSA